jgi:hypothetical protein
MIAVLFQDGSFMTFRTDFTRKKQIEEARETRDEANDGVKKGAPLARIVEIEDITIRGDVT